MDKVIEALNFASRSYWGDPNRFQFYSSIESFQDSITYEIGDNRAVRTNFNLTLNGYLIPDTINKKLANANAIKPFSAAITADATVTGNATRIRLDSGSINGTANVSAVYLRIRDGVGSITGNATVTAIGSFEIAGSASITANGQVEVNYLRIRTDAGNITGTTTVSCLAGYEVSGSGQIVGNATVYCLGGIVTGASASITPIATVTANGVPAAAPTKGAAMPRVAAPTNLLADSSDLPARLVPSVRAVVPKLPATPLVPPE